VELFFAITENNKDIERRPDEQKATAINIYPQKGRKFYHEEKFRDQAYLKYENEKCMVDD
jgi:hypothetical protein